MAKESVLPGVLDMFGPGGNVQLDRLELEPAYANRIESLRDLIERYDREVGIWCRSVRVFGARGVSADRQTWAGGRSGAISVRARRVASGLGLP
jgi:hypothetical protein